MAHYNGNNAYLSINGRVLGAASGADSNVFISASLKLSTGDEETSAGSGISWEEHADKLSVVEATFEIAYDVGVVDDDLDAVTDALGIGQVVAIIYGPEGNTTGQPKHQQDFLVTGVDGPKVDVKKTRAMFSISAKSTGVPTSNLYAGDVW
jgi:hypothetical protein